MATICRLEGIEVISPSKAISSFTLEISAPQLHSSGGYFCTVTDPHLGGDEMIRGSNSLKVICLAIRFLHLRMQHMKGIGYSWRYIESGEEFTFIGYPGLCLDCD